MATATLFEPDSLEFRDQLQRRLTETLRKLAIERAASEGRDVVTKEDMRQIVGKAIDLVMEELQAAHAHGED
ncbi:MAG: hypothetical protein WDZ59_15760 [Pirellulales bacterium]